jgi:lipopolysaccharide biosynthesis regulator YciM
MNLLALLTAGAAGVAAGATITWLVLAGRRGPARADQERYEHLLAEGMRRLAARDLTGASSALREAAEMRTDVPLLFLIVGDLCREQGELERASVVHRTLLARRDLPRTLRGSALLALARDERAQGQLEEAERLLRRASEESPRDADPLVELGLLLETQGRWDEALEAAEGVRRLDGGRGQTILARRQVARALERLAGGDLSGARASLEAALHARPGLAAAEIGLGDLHYQEGRPGLAAQRWESLLDREPERAHLVLDRLERIHREEGRPQETRRLAATLAERCPVDWRLLVFLGEAALAAGEPEEADRWLSRLAEVWPGSAPLDRLLWKRSLAHGFDPDWTRRRTEHRGETPRWGAPFRCCRCGHESAGFRWRCSQCRGWDSFE